MLHDGGASMDSEILSAYSARNAKGEVLVINGFDRVAGPEGFQSAPYAGFPEWLDRGVGDGVELQYIGRQHDFDSRHPWISDDDSGWGQSNSDYEQMLVAGNTHDFPFIHGRAIAKAGYNIVDEYPESGESEEVMAVDVRAASGKKLLIMKYTITNNSGNNLECDLFSKDISCNITVNGTVKADSMLTMLLNDLGTLKMEIEAGTSYEAVQVFEVPENVTAVEQLELNMNMGNEIFAIQL